MNKYYIGVFSVFLLLFLAMFSYPVRADLPLQGRVVAIDCGHGGMDPGSLYNDIYEKDITLSIGKYLEKYLSEMGATVIMTRTSDSDLSNGARNHRKKADFDERIKIINQKIVDMYLSIHLNYLTDTRYYGAQVFYNKDNETLANTIQEYINANLDSDREIKEIPSSTYMYQRLENPGVLIECGFLSNANEREKLVTDEYQKKIAEVIASAIVKYYNS